MQVLEFLNRYRCFLFLEGDIFFHPTQTISSHLHRAGLELADYVPRKITDDLKKVVFFGEIACQYVENKDMVALKKVFRNFFSLNCHLVIVTVQQKKALEKIEKLCQEFAIDCMKTVLSEEEFIIKWHQIFAKKETIYLHGVFLSIYGIGVLIQSEAGLGKSAAALELLRRAHLLIADDLVGIEKDWRERLWGFSHAHLAHQLHVRGVGIVDVANSYGVKSILHKNSFDLALEVFPCNLKREAPIIKTQFEYKAFLDIPVPYFSFKMVDIFSLCDQVESVVLNYKRKQLSDLGLTEEKK